MRAGQYLSQADALGSYGALEGSCHDALGCSTSRIAVPAWQCVLSHKLDCSLRLCSSWQAILAHCSTHCVRAAAVFAASVHRPALITRSWSNHRYNWLELTTGALITNQVDLSSQ